MYRLVKNNINRKYEVVKEDSLKDKWGKVEEKIIIRKVNIANRKIRNTLGEMNSRSMAVRSNGGKPISGIEELN